MGIMIISSFCKYLGKIGSHIHSWSIYPYIDPHSSFIKIYIHNYIHIDKNLYLYYRILCQYLLTSFNFLFISWRLITLQYCSGFCHTLTLISHGFTCIPHPDPPSHLPPHPIPLGLPSAPAPSTCLMHPACAGDLFHPR